jgi:glycosyltransferase involved in cell wall biosynthesis
MSAAPAISVIVRARDEAGSLRRCLEVLQAQQIGDRGLEIVVVDGGSVDDTPQVAARLGARVVVLPAHAFSYGRALNLGCANSRGALIVPVSAHAFPSGEGWLRGIAEPFEDPRVACAAGDLYGPDGTPLRQRIEQDLALARARPEWGYSNSAGALRAELWRRRPFRADLVGCEDKEWALHWLERGYVCVVDRSFVVDHDHTHDPVRRIYARARCEWEGMGSFIDLEPYGARELARDWWSDLRWYRSSLRARLSHRRAARLLGAWAGRRRARRS